MLAGASLPVAAVAAQLMRTPPLGEAWIASPLARAAEQASARGAPAAAIFYLERALAERPSERRVCRLAADGLTNGGIARALFVTTRTVENHLGHAYRKLDIESRAELPRTLGASQS